ncbi:MAG: hypothetical protein M3552_11940 [Planctomycetota bacterium]|nr:hypothetical protein [Planctomycetaceae bacterium]MDQ3331345.1 hypothetical protein [Planctomycetota bacterium]
MLSTGRLEQLMESVMFVRDGASGRFSATFDALERLADEQGIAIAVVGGMAAVHHGYATTTEDVDILLASAQADDFLRAAPTYGFIVRRRFPRGRYVLEHSSGVELDVVPEGGRPRDDAPAPIPSPTHVGVSHGLAYASLEGWIEIKLGANRLKDRAHVVEVLKTLEASTVERIKRHLHSVHSVLVQRFEELADIAESERSGRGESP